MIFKIILKTKNEVDLLEKWIKYYSKMVGIENIIIFDNHSENIKVLEIYEKYNLNILKIDVPNNINFYDLNKDFYDNIISTCDWFAVLDTDEFLCLYKDNIFSVDGVLDLLESSSEKALGSIWLNQMHFDNTNEYFKIGNSLEEKINNKKFGKTVYSTSYPRIRNIIYGHNSNCINENRVCDANMNSGLILLHLDRMNWDIRIRNCIDMCIHSSSSPNSIEHSKFCESINRELKIIKHINNNKIDSSWISDSFLNAIVPNEAMNSAHKLFEIQEYYINKEEYIKKYYGKEKEYIRTNIINNYIYGEKYIQETPPKIDLV